MYVSAISKGSPCHLHVKRTRLRGSPILQAQLQGSHRCWPPWKEGDCEFGGWNLWEGPFVVSCGKNSVQPKKPTSYMRSSVPFFFNGKRFQIMACCQRKVWKSNFRRYASTFWNTYPAKCLGSKESLRQTFARFQQISHNQTNSCFIIDSKALNKFHRAQGTTLVLAALVFNSGLWVGCHSWHSPE